MTGGGAPGAPGILKCLQSNPLFHIITADANPEAVGRYLNAEFEKVPFASDENFIDVLLHICRKRNIHIVLPLVTKELVRLSQRKNDFDLAGTKLLVSETEGLEIANNKSRLYQFLEWRGIKVPAYRIVESVDQFTDAIKELGYPNRAVCFKPSISNGSRGFRILDPKVNEYDLLFNQKPGNCYMQLSEAVRVLSSQTFPELLVSEFLPGEEFSVDCLANHGEPKLVFPRVRRKMVNGISVEGQFVKNKEVIDYCSQIISALKLHGNIGIQVRRSGEGQCLILEINPRVQGTVVAALGAGVNLPALAIKQELGLSIHDGEMDLTWGTKFSRFWNEVFY